VRVPRRRKRVGPATNAPVLIAQAPNARWRSNFQYDSTTDGRLVKFLSACAHLAPTC
jgi:putative transposase